MILTCPECATGYFVDDAQIKPGGRMVRCASCGARWLAQPDTPLELTSSESEGAVAKEPSPADLEPSELTGDDLPKVFRERASEQEKMRQARLAGLVWGGVALLVVVVVVCLVVFREAIVRAVPSTAAAYKAIGMPVNRVGLTIEGVHAEPALQDGHAALSVSMTVRNVEDHPIDSPPLSIVLLNAQGKRVGGQIVHPANPRIAPGEQKYFTVAILDPPLTAHDLEVTFAMDAIGRTPTARPVAHPVSAATPALAPAPALRGAASPEEPAAGGDSAAVVPISPAAAAGASTAAPAPAKPAAPAKP
ncbi:MJ0042-type zinc finger domain-containing protein [Caulobacter sp. KR2-114]|uniref:MJ0042-type zinc finger domain-containing protein n=1 Tax=Caulobacter sp. KR2-114 TaxID=3400912 RepID=UPI003C0D4854